MGLPITTILSLGLLAALPSTSTATSTSLHYKLRAKVTGPWDATTPDVNGWAIEIYQLPVPTHGVPPDYSNAVLWNQTFQARRDGDVFYTQPTHVRTDAPNAGGEVTPFGFSVGEPFSGYYLVSAAAVAVRSNTAETVADVVVGEDGVPFLEKPGFAGGTWVACKQTYEALVNLYWADLDYEGTEQAIYDLEDWRNCTAIQLVPECVAGGPEVEGLVETPCVDDVTTVL